MKSRRAEIKKAIQLVLVWFPIPNLVLSVLLLLTRANTIFKVTCIAVLLYHSLKVYADCQDFRTKMKYYKKPIFHKIWFNKDFHWAVVAFAFALWDANSIFYAFHLVLSFLPRFAKALRQVFPNPNIKQVNEWAKTSLTYRRLLAVAQVGLAPHLFLMSILTLDGNLFFAFIVYVVMISLFMYEYNQDHQRLYDSLSSKLNSLQFQHRYGYGQYLKYVNAFCKSMGTFAEKLYPAHIFSDSTD